MTPSPDTHLPLDDAWALWRLGAVRTAGFPVERLESLVVADADPGERRRRSSRAVRELVADDGFAEAVTWQNLPLVDNWLGDFRDRVRHAGPDDDVPLARRSQREPLVALLAQRYCAKNETIGFFGPVAWARFVDERGALTWSGTLGLRSRTLFVEHHAVARLGKAIAANPGTRPHLPIRRHPLCGVANGLVYPPRGTARRLPDAQYRVLELLDQPATEATLRARLRDVDPAEVTAAVRALEADGLVCRDLAIPLAERPEARLRELADALAEPAQEHCRRVLEPFETALSDVAAAAGRPAALRSALHRLGDVSLDLRDASSAPAVAKSNGATYGRGLVYEDARRDLDVAIGADLLAELRRPLILLLRAARWLVAEIGIEVARALRERYAQLARHGRQVMLSSLLLAAADVLDGAPGTVVHHVVDDFLARWGEVLELTDADGVLRSDAAEPLVAALFPAPRTLPWQAAHQHSPDLLLRVRPDGSPQWVLGELHLALNTLENRPFVTQADDREELLAATRRDFAGGRIVPVWPSSSVEVTSRTYPPLGMNIEGCYDYWSYAHDEGRYDGAAGWAGTALPVEQRGDELVVLAPDRSRSAPATEFFGEFLTALVVDRFHLRPPARHRPRLLIDDVVVERASWRIPLRELPWRAAPSDEADDALAAALAAVGCPAHVFAKLPGERKPILVDTRAPLLLRSFARVARRALEASADAEVELVEMLPAPDELWLRSADGASFTSEFRIVVVDEGVERVPVWTAAAAGNAPDR